MDFLFFTFFIFLFFFLYQRLVSQALAAAAAYELGATSMRALALRFSASRA